MRGLSTLRVLLLSAALSLCASAIATPTIIRVAGDTGNDLLPHDGSSWAKAKKTITAALAAASGPTRYYIKQGTYSESLLLTVSGLELYGGFAGDDAETVDPTVGLDTRCGGTTAIDPAGRGRCVFISSASNVRVDRLTLQNGVAQGPGGGLYADSSDTVAVVGCVVQDCHAEYGGNGGGVGVFGGSVSVTKTTIQGCDAVTVGGGLGAFCANVEGDDCVIAGCTAPAGGGAAFVAGSATLSHCRVVDNHAVGQGACGGGITARGSAGVHVNSCLVARNTASDGSGGALECASGGALGVQDSIVTLNISQTGTLVVHDQYSFANLVRDTIADNQATGGAGAVLVSNGGVAWFQDDIIAYNAGVLGAIARDTSSSYTFVVVCLWSNAPRDFADQADDDANKYTCFRRDPLFCSRQPGFIGDPLSYILRPKTATFLGSKFIDFAATQGSEDFLGDPRRVGRTGISQPRSDVGAFEYQWIDQRVSLPGWVGPNSGDMSVLGLHVVVTPHDGSMTGWEDYVPLAPDGFYLLHGPAFAAGHTYDVKFEVPGAPGYLSHTMTVTGPLPCGYTGLSPTLIPGNAFVDSSVNLADLSAVVGNLGPCDGPTSADINCDGTVDLVDFCMVLANFGEHAD